MRIVSLLPSATETLCAIGGGHLLVGRSHECDFPSSIAHLPVLTAQKTAGGTSAEIDQQVRDALNTESVSTGSVSLYSLNVDLLRSLQPDLILTQDLCEVCSIDLSTVRTIAASLDPQPHILSLDPHSLDDVFDDMLRVGEAAGLVSRSREAMIALRERAWAAREYVNAYIEGPIVAFLEWMDPLFVGGHWTPQLIQFAGGRHTLNAPGEKSRRISPEELIETMPERLIICPCGYNMAAIERELPALQSQRWWKLLPAVQDGKIALVDGNQMFNRPGPRLVDALCWLVAWLHDLPELTPTGFPVTYPAAAQAD
ncbi:MAG TPA: ABC transporter substrate-binding protein [Phycisphaerales bacterium]|nr:ABC transporter substrate-binding protein [Phycisphaerales bacterium]HRQ76622.1 ABC transporter substrate-binding protein [Phycisphaerales bacterium]